MWTLEITKTYLDPSKVQTAKTDNLFEGLLFEKIIDLPDLLGSPFSFLSKALGTCAWLVSTGAMGLLRSASLRGTIDPPFGQLMEIVCNFCWFYRILKLMLFFWVHIPHLNTNRSNVTSQPPRETTRFYSEAIWWITVGLLQFTASAMAQGVAPIQLENGEKIIQYPIRFRISVSCHVIFTCGLLSWNICYSHFILTIVGIKYLFSMPLNPIDPGQSSKDLLCS